MKIKPFIQIDHWYDKRKKSSDRIKEPHKILILFKTKPLKA
jgi:hypothetical protein